MSHIYRRGGAWWYAHYAGGRKIRTSLKTANKRVAQAKKAQLDLKYAQHPNHGQVNKDLSFNEAFQLYLQATSPLRSPGWQYTIRRYLSIFSAALGHCKISDLTSGQVEQALTQLTLARKSRAKTYNSYLAIMRTFSRWCEGHGYVVSDFTRGIKSRDPEETERTWLTREERDKVLKFVEGTRYYPVFMTAFYTGLRWKEMATLDHKDVDLSGKIITVRPQNAKSKRTRHISIHPRLEAVLAKRSRPSGFVFDIQARTDYVRYKKELRWWFRKIGVKGDRLGFHTCRHTFISLLLQNEASLWDVAGLAGHSDAKTTQKHYAHRLKSYDPSIERL